MRVYLLTTTKDDGIYIGQTINTIEFRFAGHKKAARRKKYNFYLYNAINKYGFDSFSIHLIEECNSLDELNNAEEFYIAYYKSIGAKLYNIKPGGKNHKMAESTKLKLRNLKLGTKSTEECKQKISKSLMGNKYGVGKGTRSVIAYNIVYTDILFNSINEAAEYFKSFPENISAVLNGKRKTLKGYKFKYAI